MQFMGDDLFFVESTEPTNIIWENRHFTAQEYAKRTLVACTIIFFLLCISFAAIFICKSIAITRAAKYPTVDCDDVTKLYKDANMTNYAYREYIAFYEPDTGMEPTPFSGSLQCYCASQKNLGMTLMSQVVTNLEGTQGSGRKICESYVTDQWVGLGYNQSVSYMIIAINYVLRLFIIKLIIYIGKDTESEQTRLITNGIFIVQFFNTGFLLLSVNANLQEQGLGFIFSRRMADFESTWFIGIGNTLVAAMMFNIYWPLIEFFGFWGMRFGFRLLDRRWKFLNALNTHKTTIQQYVEVYSGPTFFIHYKYSFILNITFVTFMYGMGLPILFPIAAMSFLMLYCMEKLMIHYSYRQPPMYDERLNNNVLAILTYAPLLFLSFGYWMMSSKQLLHNELTAFGNKSDVPITGHKWTQVFSCEQYNLSNPEMPLLIMFWLCLIGIVFRNFFYKHLSKWFPAVKVGELEIDEDLDNYFNTLDDHDRNWSTKEEEYSRSVLKMNVLEDETLEKLKSTKMGKSHMKGVHCYDILANPLYLDDFQYFSCAMDDRANYIIDDDEDEDNDNAQSDLVKVILNLAFLTKDEAKAFQFSKDAYKGKVKGKATNKIQ